MENQEIYNINEETKELTIIHKNGLDDKKPFPIVITGNIDSVRNWLEKRTIAIPGKPNIEISDINSCDDCPAKDDCPENYVIPEDKREVKREGIVTEESEENQKEAQKELLRKKATVILGHIEQLTDSLSEAAHFNPQNMVEQKEAHILIDRDEMSIELVMNEIDPLLRGSIIGSLSFHPDFDKWYINSLSGATWDHEQLAEFIKMNRSCFDDRNTAMKLSTGLKSLKVNVEKELEKENDNRGNYRLLALQRVKDMSIPKTFHMNVPIFKGQPKVSFEVEIYLDPHNYKISLISPEANDAVSDVRDEIINKEKTKITDLAPEIVIIEK